MKKREKNKADVFKDREGETDGRHKGGKKKTYI